MINYRMLAGIAYIRWGVGNSRKAVTQVSRLDNVLKSLNIKHLEYKPTVERYYILPLSKNYTLEQSQIEDLGKTIAEFIKQDFDSIMKALLIEWNKA